MGNNKSLESDNLKMNFSKGWGIIFYCMAMFFLLVGYSIDGLNIVAPTFAEVMGLDYPVVLSMSAIAGLVGIVAYIVISRINIKVGARWVSGFCLIGSGISYICWGQARSIAAYCVALTLVTSFINGAAYIAGGALVAQWFPKKKGLANGFTTMGHNEGSAFFVPLITFLLASFGFSKGMAMAGIFGIVLGVAGLVFIRNFPQECGMYPDNVTKEVYETEYAAITEQEKSQWTVVKLLKTKELWLCAVIVGVNQLVTTGVMSQLVVRNMGIGLSQTAAVTLMTVCACIGVAGSFGFGFLDQKFGVKKSILFFLIWYSMALIINCTDTLVGIYISVLMLGVAIGAAGNFIMSLPTSVFGRHGFEVVNSVYFPLMQVILMMNYFVNAMALKLTGSLRGAYIVYIGLLVVNMVLVGITNVTKHNKDYAKGEQLKQGMK